MINRSNNRHGFIDLPAIFERTDEILGWLEAGTTPGQGVALSDIMSVDNWVVLADLGLWPSVLAHIVNAGTEVLCGRYSTKVLHLPAADINLHDVMTDEFPPSRPQAQLACVLFQRRFNAHDDLEMVEVPADPDELVGITLSLFAAFAVLVHLARGLC